MDSGSRLAEVIEVSILFLNFKISDLEKRKKQLDDEVETLQKRTQDMAADLIDRIRRNPRLCHESLAQRRQRILRKKQLTVAVAATLTSIPVAILSKRNESAKILFPIFTAVGTGSLVYSGYLGRKVRQDFRNYEFNSKSDLVIYLWKIAAGAYGITDSTQGLEDTPQAEDEEIVDRRRLSI